MVLIESLVVVIGWAGLGTQLADLADLADLAG
jgi:hypothetical protein